MQQITFYHDWSEAKVVRTAPGVFTLSGHVGGESFEPREYRGHDADRRALKQAARVVFDKQPPPTLYVKTQTGLQQQITHFRKAA